MSDMWNYVPAELRYVVYALLAFAMVTTVAVVRLLTKRK